MNEEETLSDLIGTIYDAVGNPVLWERFLLKFADLVEGSMTSLVLYSPEQRMGALTCAVRFDLAYQQLYNEYYVSIDQWGANSAGFISPGNVVPGQALCSDRTLERSEFYADFLRPLDCFHEVSGVISVDGPHISLLASCRPKRSGPFGPQEERMLRLIMPHLQRAVRLHGRIAELESVTNWQANTLNRWSTGIVMISERRRVLILNAYAQAVVAQNDGLRCSTEGLHAARPSDTKLLRSLIERAIPTALREGMSHGGTMLLPRPSQRRALQVLVSPYRPAKAWPGQEQPAVTVFITDPELQPEPPVQLLIRLYGLTPAEAKFAALLMSGSSVAEAAEQLHIAINTARAHLKQVFAKTGTKRQGELVRQLLLGPTSLMPEHADSAVSAVR